MKKITTVAAIALFAVAFTSCKKDYTCECKDNADGTVFASNTYKKTTKKDAKSSCDQANATGQLIGVSCSLK